LVVVLVGLSGPAKAQPGPVDSIAAEKLFRDARELMDAGKYDEACPKLAESQRLDPGGGTMLNLALCHQHQGRLATAWTEYHEALAMARKDGRADREELALEQLGIIEPQLSYLTIEVAPAAKVDGLTVSLDGTAIGEAAWGTALPVDPGKHRLVASAPGKRDRQIAIQIGGKQRRSVRVPPLLDAPSPARKPPDPDAVDQGQGQRIAGWVVIGVGGALAALGTAAGILAIDKRAQSDEQCPDERCNPDGVRLNEDAQTAATLANIGIFGGAAVAATGLVVLLTSPSAPKPGEPSDAAGLRLVPAVGPRGGGLSLTARW